MITVKRTSKTNSTARQATRRVTNDTNFGTKPTVSDKNIKTLETHILQGFNQDIYAEELEIKFLSFKLKGTDIKLHDIERKEEIQKNIQKDDINTEIKVKEDLPDELKEIFNKLREEIEKRDIDQN